MIHWRTFLLAYLYLLFPIYFAFAQSTLPKPYQEILSRYSEINLGIDQFPLSTEGFKDSSLTLLGRWPWGSCDAVTSNADYVYVGNGALIQIVNANSSPPFESLGEFFVDFQVTHLEVEGDLLLVGAGSYLKLFDLTEPTDPVFLGETFLNGGGPILRISSQNNQVVLTKLGGIIWTEDKSDPVNNRCDNSRYIKT